MWLTMRHSSFFFSHEKNVLSCTAFQRLKATGCAVVQVCSMGRGACGGHASSALWDRHVVHATNGQAPGLGHCVQPEGVG